MTRTPQSWKLPGKRLVCALEGGGGPVVEPSLPLIPGSSPLVVTYVWLTRYREKEVYQLFQTILKTDLDPAWVPTKCDISLVAPPWTYGVCEDFSHRLFITKNTFSILSILTRHMVMAISTLLLIL